MIVPQENSIVSQNQESQTNTASVASPARVQHGPLQMTGSMPFVPPVPATDKPRRLSMAPLARGLQTTTNQVQPPAPSAPPTVNTRFVGHYSNLSCGSSHRPPLCLILDTEKKMYAKVFKDGSVISHFPPQLSFTQGTLIGFLNDDGSAGNEYVSLQLYI